MLSPAGELTAPLAVGDRNARVHDLAELTVVEAIAEWEAEWRGFEPEASGHVFQTYDFVSVWLRTIGVERGVIPRVVVGRGAGGALKFILPLGVRRHLGQRVLEWVGGEHADYHCGLYDRRFLAWLAAEPEQTARFRRSVFQALSGEADVLNFSRQPEDIDGLPNPFAGHRALRHAASRHQTRLGDCWETYYRGKRNSSARRKDRSKLRNLEAIGPVRLIDAVSPEDATRVMMTLFAQKERGLGQRGVTGFFACPAVRTFYAALALAPYPLGPAHVAALECDGEIVAANWGLVRGDRYYYVMHSFAESGEAARYSPGRHLMHHLMRWCIERGIATFDFTIGDEGFKDHWCEESYPLYDGVAALGGRGIPLALGLRSAKTLKRVIKGSPMLLSAAEQVRRGWSAARA